MGVAGAFDGTPPPERGSNRGAAPVTSGNARQGLKRACISIAQTAVKVVSDFNCNVCDVQLSNQRYRRKPPNEWAGNHYEGIERKGDGKQNAKAKQEPFRIARWDDGLIFFGGDVRSAAVICAGVHDASFASLARPLCTFCSVSRFGMCLPSLMFRTVLSVTSNIGANLRSDTPFALWRANAACTSETMF